MTLDEKKFAVLLGVGVEAVLGELRLKLPVYTRILWVAVVSAEHSLFDMQKALDAKDLKSVAQIAHELKGAYANLRILPVVRLSADILAGARESLPVKDMMCKFTDLQQGLSALKGCFHDPSLAALTTRNEGGL